MDAERFHRLEALFARGAALPLSEREAFIRQQCGDDDPLGEKLRHMLRLDDAGTRGDLAALAEDAGALIAAGGGEFARADPWIGRTVGDYELVGVLGSGGMGVVYRARDRRLGRTAALKLLNASPGGSPGGAAARPQLDEARAAATLDHPNIGTIYGVGEAEDGRIFIAMAEHRGETLRQRLRRLPPIDVDEALDVAIQASRAVGEAHRHRIVHGDIKPENLMLTRSGLVKLLDFGLAHAVGADGDGPLIGTPAYMSPEQAAGARQDTRSDIWSFGVVLYESLYGEHPFPAADVPQAVGWLRGEEPVKSIPDRSDVPAELETIVRRCLAREPADRFADGSALQTALESLAPRLQRSRLADWSGRIAPVGTRRWRLPAAAILAGLAVLLLVRVVSEWNTGHQAGPGGASLAAVIVHPFDTAGAGQDSRHISAGMTDQLVTELRALSGIRVLGPSAGRPLLESGKSATQIARRLGMDYSLHGSLETVGDRIRVSTRLVDARTEEDLWSETFERPYTMENLYQIPTAVTRSLSGHIGGSMAPRAIPSPLSIPTTNLVAYERFLRGNLELVRRTPASVLRAAAEYRAARDLDPDFGAAFAREAYAYCLFVDWGWIYPGLSREDLLERSRDLVDNALAFAPASTDSWLTRGYLLVQLDPYRMTGALDAFERAIALDPSNAEAYHQYGQSLTALGRWAEAKAAYHATLALEPARAMTLVPLAAISQRTRDYEQALRWADSAIAVGPGTPYAWATRAAIRNGMGDHAGAAEDARAALRIDPSYAIPAHAALAAALHGQGDREGADRELARALAALPDAERPGPTDALFLAGALVHLGRTGEALALIEQAEPRSAWLWFYLQNPAFDPLRDQPRFRLVEGEADPRD